MGDFEDYLKRSYEFRKNKELREKELSKEKLLNAAKKKIQTTMIGSLSSVEKYLGFLWDSPNPSHEQQELQSLFEELRSEILDRGNTQMRNLENEFNYYDIVWKKYSIKLPVQNKGEGYE